MRASWNRAFVLIYGIGASIAAGVAANRAWAEHHPWIATVAVGLIVVNAACVVVAWGRRRG